MTLRSIGGAAAALLLAGCAAAPAPAATPPSASGAAPGAPERPALVVLLVVDQLRGDLLTQYDSLWTGGFRRLMDEGHHYVLASHAHAATVTATGHATLSTGVYPSRHGVIGNSWWEPSNGRWVTVENIADTTVRIVGFPQLAGVSPVHLMRSGLAEWIAAANPRSQVASVSGKDRGAVQPAAHAKGQVYWFEEEVGRFVTSTYYRDAYPAWVGRFHETVLPRYAADTVWRSEVPTSARGAVGADTAAWEGDAVHTAFPHHFSEEARPDRYWAWFASTPALDALTLDFAETMVTELALGRDDAVDFLNVSLSQTDRIGHGYGPHSLEQLDNLLRLDRELGDFLAFLDATVGRGRWVAALSADHGVLDAPEEHASGGAGGRRATRAERATMDSLVSIADARGDDPRAAADLAAALERLPWVAEAWTRQELLRKTPSDSFAVLFRRSIYPGRAGGRFSAEGVEVRFVEGFIFGDRGSTHGSPYWYDRLVPMIFVGPGILAGRDSASGVFTVDLAPTLARLAGVRTPADLDGRPLPAVVGAGRD